MFLGPVLAWTVHTCGLKHNNYNSHPFAKSTRVYISETFPEISACYEFVQV